MNFNDSGPASPAGLLDASVGALGSVALSAQPDGKGPGTFGWSGGAGTTAFVDPALGIRAAGYGQFIPASAISFRADVPKAVYGTD